MTSNVAVDPLLQAQIEAGERFSFGNNWSRFLQQVGDNRIAIAEQSIRQLLKVDNLQGTRFLDIGSGSGLFSLAARRLGASVRSFDYDPASVACTMALKQRYFPDDEAWQISSGSALDADFMRSLGEWDVVYSWGVLHHTGNLWQACRNAARAVVPGGLLALAIYNDQGEASRWWLRVKQLYNRLPPALRWVVLGPAVLRLWGPTMVRDALQGRPFNTWRSYARNSLRGMSPWHDAVDWVGGLPFEVASPAEVFTFHKALGFRLRTLRTCGGGLGCNEFVFQRTIE